MASMSTIDRVRPVYDKLKDGLGKEKLDNATIKGGGPETVGALMRRSSSGGTPSGGEIPGDDKARQVTAQKTLLGKSAAKKPEKKSAGNSVVGSSGASLGK